MVLRGTWTTGNNIGLELATSRNVTCAYNTFYSSQADFFCVISLSESLPGKIEGIAFKYNLVRGRIFDQTDGAGWTTLGNLLDGAGTVITPQWFVAPLSGDLHLTPAATRALDAGMLIGDLRMQVFKADCERFNVRAIGARCPKVYGCERFD